MCSVRPGKGNPLGQVVAEGLAFWSVHSKMLPSSLRSTGGEGEWSEPWEFCLMRKDRIKIVGSGREFTLQDIPALFSPPSSLLFAAAREDSTLLFNYSSWENSKLFPSMNYLHSWENRFLSNISGILPFAHRGECCRDLSWQVC